MNFFYQMAFSNRNEKQKNIKALDDNEKIEKEFDRIYFAFINLQKNCVLKRNIEKIT